MLTLKSKAKQFNDVRMTKEFKVLNFPFNAVMSIATQLCAVDKLERDLLMRG
jgi:hypothetical protein